MEVSLQKKRTRIKDNLFVSLCKHKDKDILVLVLVSNPARKNILEKKGQGQGYRVSLSFNLVLVLVPIPDYLIS